MNVEVHIYLWTYAAIKVLYVRTIKLSIFSNFKSYMVAKERSRYFSKRGWAGVLFDFYKVTMPVLHIKK